VQHWRTATRGKMAGLAVLLRHPGQSIAYRKPPAGRWRALHRERL